MSTPLARVGAGLVLALLTASLPAAEPGGITYPQTGVMPQPKPAAPALPPVLAPDDTEESAYTKLSVFLRERMPANRAETIRRLQAYREFGTRFPDSPNYYRVKRYAVGLWSTPGFRLTDAEEKDWGCNQADQDPRLTLEERADLASLIANARAIRTWRRDGKTFNDANFDEAVIALQPYLATTAARQSLTRQALNVAPARAIPALRAAYPDDKEVAECITLIESIGRPCEFKFTALDGRIVDSKDLLGKVVLLDFWSRGCGPCLAMIPRIKESLAAFGPQGFVVIGVSLDDKREDAEWVEKKFEIPWPSHFDGAGWKNEMARRFFISAIPHGVLIDRQGRLYSTGESPGTQATNAKIAELLRQK